MPHVPQKFGRVWWTLLAAPVLFLLAIVIASIYFGLITQGKNIEAIPELVTSSVPYQLLAVQIFLFFILIKSMKSDKLTWTDIGWKAPEGQLVGYEIITGSIFGIVLGALYIFVLSPMLTNLQGIWDYVPAGELFTTLGAAIIPFSIANVLLAPFIEESIYRGYGWTRLLGRFGRTGAIILSCCFFGILHWTGGFWYILLTGSVAGGLLIWLRFWRRNIIAPFAAHLALNLVETIFIIMAIL